MASSLWLIHQKWRLYPLKSWLRHLPPNPCGSLNPVCPGLSGQFCLGCLGYLPQGLLPQYTAVLSGVFTDVEASLKDIKNLLEEDELQEQKLQEAVGQAGASPAVTKAELAEVRREWAKYMEVHEKASFTNSELHRAMNLHVNNLRLLSGPLDQVRAALPTPALTPGEPACHHGKRLRSKGFFGLTDYCCPQRTRLCCRT